MTLQTHSPPIFYFSEHAIAVVAIDPPNVTPAAVFAAIVPSAATTVAPPVAKPVIASPRIAIPVKKMPVAHPNLSPPLIVDICDNSIFFICCDFELFINTRLVFVVLSNWAYSIFLPRTCGTLCSVPATAIQSSVNFSLGQQRKNVPQFVRTEYV